MGFFFKMNQDEIKRFKEITSPGWPNPAQEFLTHSFKEKGAIEFFPLMMKIENKITNCYYIFDRTNDTYINLIDNRLKSTKEYQKLSYDIFYHFKNNFIKVLNYRKNLVNQFKAGMHTNLMLNIFLMAFGKDFFKGKILIPIAASDNEKSNKRYSKFMSNLCDLTGCENGMGLISIKSKESKYISGIKLKSDDFIIKNYISDKIINKNIILIDDVFTSGHTSFLWSEKLIEYNPKSIQCIFLAKQLSPKKILKRGK